MTRLVRSEPVPMWPRGDRRAAPVGVTDVGHRVEGAETQGECQLGSSPTHPGDDRPQEARPVLQRSTEVAVALVGAEQLVMEVPVAGLEIDEVEAGIMGVHGGLDEVVGELVQLVVGEQWMVRRGPNRGVEVRVAAYRHRRCFPGRRRVAHPAGVRELQPDNQIGDVAVDAFVLRDQAPAKFREIADRGVGDHQLRWRAAAVGAHRR